MTQLSGVKFFSKKINFGIFINFSAARACRVQELLHRWKWTIGIRISSTIKHKLKQVEMDNWRGEGVKKQKSIKERIFVHN